MYFVQSMKRPHLRPDLRPNWRDLDMPVLRDYKMGDGTVRTVVDPTYEARYRAFMMESAPHPHYTKDPTYHLKRKL